MTGAKSDPEVEAEVAPEVEAEVEPAAATRPQGEDPWEVPCSVCGLLGCRRHS